MNERQSNIVQRRIVHAAIGSVLAHPVVGVLATRIALPGVSGAWTAIGAFAATWLVLLLAYLRFDKPTR